MSVSRNGCHIERKNGHDNFEVMRVDGFTGTPIIYYDKDVIGLPRNAGNETLFDGPIVECHAHIGSSLS